MAKNWSYANLSKLAKVNGGPEKLVEKIENAGFVKGVIFSGVSLFTVWAVKRSYKAVKKYLTSMDSEKALESAKQELINGINAYDKDKSGG